MAKRRISVGIVIVAEWNNDAEAVAISLDIDGETLHWDPVTGFTGAETGECGNDALAGNWSLPEVHSEAIDMAIACWRKHSKECA